MLGTRGSCISKAMGLGTYTDMNVFLCLVCRKRILKFLAFLYKTAALNFN